MPKTKISEFSATPGNNTDIDGINIAEGCAPSGINDAIRELMSQLKDFQAGTAGDSFNGPVGTTTAAAGAFTILSASGAVTLSGGTANGIPYLNGSKVLTTGSALTFDGTNLGIGTSSPNNRLTVMSSSGVAGITLTPNSSFTNAGYIYNDATYIMLGSSAGSTGYKFRVALTAPDNAATIDSSGNLGLGVTPSAWGAGQRYLEINNGGASIGSGGTGTGFFRVNNFFNGTNDIYKGTAPAGAYGFNNGWVWYTAPSGTAGNAITFTQAMTLDASGRLGIGETSPAHRVSVRGTAGSTGHTECLIQVGTDADVYSAQAQIRLAGKYGDAGYAYIAGLRPTGGTATDNALVFGTVATERARIDSSGNLLVNTTSTFASSKATIKGAGNTLTVWEQNGSSSAALICRVDITSGRLTTYNYNGSDVGTVTTNGTSTSYNTSSDYRLKENIQPMTGALAVVQQLKPVTYKWKVDGSDGQGFIAHELAEVVPQCVTGEKDAVDEDGNPQYQGIDTSFLAGLYAAALQELMAEVNSLKSEIAALKA